MKQNSIEKTFRLMGRMVEEDHVYLDSALGFEGVCALLQTDLAEMDSFVRKELGISGEELFRLHRSSYRNYLFKKYANDIVNA